MKKGWIWRDKELTMKEFYSLPQTSRNEYISLIEIIQSQNSYFIANNLLRRLR